MARDFPLALRRTPRRRQQHDVEEPSRTPGTASQRKSSRSNATRRSATKTTLRTAGTKTVKSVPKSAATVSAASAETDNTADDSITLVDDTDDSITALDFDIPIASQASASASGRTTSTGISKRKRRSSVTSSSPSGGNTAIKRVRRQTAIDESNTSIVHVVPIRTQILDDHIKRRIRRNGLSEEMNEAYSEKRVRRNRTLAELRRARDDLRSRDAEIERLRELTAVFDDGVGHDDDDVTNNNAEDASRVQDLERQLARLREEVIGRQHDDVPSSSPPARHDDDDGVWGVPGGMSDRDSDAGGDFAHDFDDEFGESSVAELESGGTPSHHQKLPGRRPTALHLHGPALTPPSTSPAKLPSSPLRQIHSSGSTMPTMNSACDAGVQTAAVTTDAASQACISDPGMDTLQDELSTLRSEMASLNDTLQERDSLQARMREKLVSRQPYSSSIIQDHTGEDQDIELQLDIVLQDLGEKTSRLAALSSLLISPPTDSTPVDDKEMTAQLASTLRSIRQALEDLNPDTTLPPSTIDTLALAATRLRELDTALAQRTAELEASRAAEATLRSQLAGSDARAASLAQDASQLGQTVAALRDEVAILKEELDGARDDAALQRDAAVAEAEARLADALARLVLIEGRLAGAEEARRAGEVEAGALRGEVSRLSGALEEAQGTVVRLREGGVREREAAREAVGTMRMELLRALQVGEGFLAGASDGERGVAKMEEGVAAAVVPVVRVDKTARGRSDDSGLGLLEEGGE
ncbi:hypothetical protein Daus18300_000313 [Diaporthe australafricana]|uniref:BZIP domain-containing protein n=1 Tax=Diaporthe australafricana TaxID=127596 RepID=A0ABR3Y4M0_9PEZI